jgi:hypothetical protein
MAAPTVAAEAIQPSWRDDVSKDLTKKSRAASLKKDFLASITPRVK